MKLHLKQTQKIIICFLIMFAGQLSLYAQNVKTHITIRTPVKEPYESFDQMYVYSQFPSIASFDRSILFDGKWLDSHTLQFSFEMEKSGLVNLHKIFQKGH